MFNFFEELFAPGRKHTSDERRRLELSRVDLGVGDPDRGPIDLTSGKVIVRVPARDGAFGQDGGPPAANGPVGDARAPGGDARAPGGPPAGECGSGPGERGAGQAVPEQDAVLDRPRTGKPVSGPERRAEEDAEE
ncbi:MULTISPECIES: DUF6191 domain-containing protein [Streptomyces]|uniref:DUF6191 domain-containing protein n=1 Tax=Streptomyces TaxID=1883 RepID=UPI00296F45D8|nr:DUF6191 domain-containing protein [Streptomyces californicus]MDW4898802.1 DUF6191 domain-containing protein [Streptomyces californicus]